MTAPVEAPPYAPERWLCEWLAARGDATPVVWSFDRVGARPVRVAYAWLVREIAPDAIVLVDGGTDILMRGDEQGLGTPEEDLTSLAAVSSLDDVATLALVCVGFGIDAFHGVCHARFLENVAALDEEGGFWGAFSLLRSSPEVAGYLDLVRTVHEAHPAELSLVNGSIAAAMEGRFGDWHFSRRTAHSELFINPLMALCWAFDLRAVAARAYALPELADTRTMMEVACVIEGVAARLTTRPKRSIPV